MDSPKGLALVNEQFLAPGIQADDVQAVDVTTIGGIPQGMVREEYPDNMLNAKFSIPYAVAAAIVQGGTDISVFYPDAVDNDMTRDLAGRVNVVLDASMTMRRDDQPCAIRRKPNARTRWKAVSTTAAAREYDVSRE